MAERVPLDSTTFVEDFNRMLNVANSGVTAWYNDPAQWNASRAPYEIWEQRGSAERVEGSRLRPEVPYDVWPLEAPDQRRVEVQRPDHGGKPVIRRGTGKDLVYNGQVKPVTPIQTVSAFGRHAPTGDALVIVSDVLVSHLNRGDWPTAKRTALARTTGHLIARSLLIGPGPNSAYSQSEGEPGPFPLSLDAIAPGRNRELVRGYVSTFLRRVLRGEVAELELGSIRQDVLETPRAFTAHAALDMDHADLLTRDFWWVNGVVSSMVFDTDAGGTILRGLEASLAVSGESLLANVPADKLQPIMRRYVTELLVTASRDPNRDQEKLRRIIDALLTDRSRKMSTGDDDISIDLRTLIALSNGLARGLNANLLDRGIKDPSLQLPELNRDMLWNVPAALLRVLYATVRPDADPEAMADMFERDGMHVSVLEAMRERVRYQPGAPSEADVRLRNPAATAADMPELLQQSASPAGYRQLYTWRTARRRSAGRVNGYGLFLSGGALS